MTRTIDQQADEFSNEIFASPWRKLDMDQQFFVMMHVREYRKYRKSITTLAKTVMRTSIRGDQYETIRQWYFQRIPLNTVLNAMRKTIKYVITAGKPVFSVKYFSTQIQAEFKADNIGYDEFRGVIASRFKHIELPDGQEIFDKWMFHTYKGMKNKSKFNPFYGPY